ESIMSDPSLVEPLLSQLRNNSMLFQMQGEASQSSRTERVPEPLPDSNFIMTNRPSARPVPPTTATKKGRGRISKRKEKATVATNKEKGAAGKKNKK
ncbi:hypothetical protein EJB05_21396, partial [Eragrostis curvula]